MVVLDKLQISISLTELFDRLLGRFHDKRFQAHADSDDRQIDQFETLGILDTKWNGAAIDIVLVATVKVHRYIVYWWQHFKCLRIGAGNDLPSS